MIRMGVVGLGKMGLSHLAMVRALPDVEVVAVVDSAGYVLDVLAKYTGLATFGELEAARRLERRVPHPALAVAVSGLGETHLRVRVVATDRASQRNLHLAAHRQEHDGCRVAVWRTAGTRTCRLAQAARFHHLFREIEA